MARLDYARCKRCKRHRNEVGHITHRRYCRSCALEVEQDNMDALIDHRGERFEHWRLRTAAAVGAIPLDLLDTYLATRQDRS